MVLEMFLHHSELLVKKILKKLTAGQILTTNRTEIALRENKLVRFSLTQTFHSVSNDRL